jgi:uncharacterized protein YndB with AHSA1/START domain
MGSAETPADATAMETRAVDLTRIFDAPRELVWKVWTEPEHVMRWWGPKHFESPACTIDLRVGGTWRFCMRSPEGQCFWTRGIYREISPPERLVWTESFSDEWGHAVPATYYGMAEDWPFEQLVTASFVAVSGDRTKLILSFAGVPMGPMSDLMAIGWNESFDKIAEDLRRTAGIVPAARIRADR